LTTDRVHPLSFAQERLWFLDRFTADGPLYNLAHARRLRGPLDVAALERALREIVRRHDVLRTRIETVDGLPVQRVDETSLGVRHVDLQASAPDAREAEAQRVAMDEASRRFDLAQAPLLRVTIVHLAPDDRLLVLAVHHIIFDGWSHGVLFHELAVLYDAFTRGQSSPLPELPMQFGEYARRQREALDDEAMGGLLAYWKRQLDGAPAMLELPADRPRPPVQRFKGARHIMRFPRFVSDDVARVSRESCVTLFIALLAAFKVLLLRHTGQTDLVVGTAVSDRFTSDTEDLIGYLANTLVLRTDVSGDPTFRELARRVRDVTLDAHEHRDMPFERLVQEIRPVRALSHTPIYQTMFALQTQRTRPRFALGDATSTAFAPDSGEAWCDLTLWMEDGRDGLLGTLEYDTDLFDASTIARWADRFRSLLRGIVANPDQRISRLPLLPDAERRQVCVTWNATTAPYPADRTIHGLVEDWAARTPEALAVVSGVQRWTYHDLNARADAIACALRRHGVGPETRVGVCVERSAEMVAALLGVLKAGGAYVPVDPSHPAERVACVLEDAQASVLLTESTLSVVDRTGRVPAIDLDRLAASASAWSDEASPPVSAANLAYVLYTSGSTGRPKGVQIEHRAVVNHLTAMRREPGLDVSDVLLAVTTLSFDIAGLELWLPLTTGATVAIASRAATLDPALLQQMLTSSGATLLQATPATWRLLLEAGWPGDPRLTLLCGGEALSPDLAAALVPRGAALWNMYGPTETTIWSTCRRITDAARIDLGRPIANTDLHVLDAQGELAPIGVPGELLIGGAGLARGYLARPDLTAERFVPHPFVPGARVYRTGDRVRWTDAGTLAFLGRADHQIKLRGFRVELGEVESTLRTHPAVREAVVLLRDDGPGEARLAAYVIGDAVTPAELRAHVRRHLPDYSVPAVFVSIDAWPLTPNGKIDRRALLAREAPRGEAMTPEAPARTEMERLVLRVWSEVLDLSQVGIHDNFFEVGGHSLLMVRLHARLRQEVPQEFQIVDLFRYPTIHTQAGFFSASQPVAAQATRARAPRWNADARRAARGRARSTGPDESSL